MFSYLDFNDPSTHHHSSCCLDIYGFAVFYHHIRTDNNKKKKEKEMYKGHWAEEVVCVQCQTLSLWISFVPTEPGRGKWSAESDMMNVTWQFASFNFFFFFVVLPLFIIMDNIKEHLDSTRYFLISFEVECCCWLYFTFYENCAAH